MKCVILSLTWAHLFSYITESVFTLTVYKKALSDKMSGKNCIIPKTTEKTLVQENKSHFWFIPNATIFIWSN